MLIGRLVHNSDRSVAAAMIAGFATILCALCAASSREYIQVIEKGRSLVIQHNSGDAPCSFDDHENPCLYVDDARLLQSKMPVSSMNNLKFELWMHWLYGTRDQRYDMRTSLTPSMVAHAFQQGQCFAGSTSEIIGEGFVSALLDGVPFGEDNFKRLFEDADNMDKLLMYTTDENLSLFLDLLPDSVIEKHYSIVAKHVFDVGQNIWIMLSSRVMRILALKNDLIFDIEDILEMASRADVIDSIPDNIGERVKTEDSSAFYEPNMRVRALPVRILANMDMSSKFWKYNFALLAPDVVAQLQPESKACKTLPLGIDGVPTSNLVKILPKCIVKAFETLHNTNNTVEEPLGLVWASMADGVLVPFAEHTSVTAALARIPAEDWMHMRRKQIQALFNALNDTQCGLLQEHVFEAGEQVAGTIMTQKCFDALSEDAQVAAIRARVAVKFYGPLTTILTNAIATIDPEEAEQIAYELAIMDVETTPLIKALENRAKDTTL